MERRNYQSELRHLLYHQNVPESLREKDMVKNQYFNEFSGKVHGLFILPMAAQVAQIYVRSGAERTVRTVRAAKWVLLGVGVTAGILEQLAFEKKMLSADRFYNEVQQHQRAWLDGFYQALQLDKISQTGAQKEGWQALRSESDRESYKEQQYLRPEDRQDFMRFYFRNMNDPMKRWSLQGQKETEESSLNEWMPPHDTNLGEHNFRVTPK